LNVASSAGKEVSQEEGTNRLAPSSVNIGFAGL
jgi:hypothetical protein